MGGFITIIIMIFPAYFLEWVILTCLDKHDKRRFQKHMLRNRLHRKPLSWDERFAELHGGKLNEA